MTTISPDLDSKPRGGIAGSEIDNAGDDPRAREDLITGGQTYTSVTDTVTRLALGPTPTPWYFAFAVALALLTLMTVCLLYLFTTGVGVWGNNNPVAWAFDITNFVFWVGIGHAGTLISAILFLFRQNWRTSINRFAEAMTIFAVICAAMFPGVHVGRPWLAYWLFPIPNQMGMWPQARSPLLWDVFAVGTYASVSLVFWYMGMIPDLATLRDRTKSRTAQFVYGLFSLGWTGSSRHWHRYEKAYLILAALATPLVLSVHSVVSFDFATSQLPGWHTTIFPPYFVAGAVFGGFAMVLTLAIPCREWFGLKSIITLRHLENMCKVMLATGLIVGYAYSVEFLTAWYSGHHYEQFVFMNRPMGPYAWAFWSMVTCNIIAPQILWFKKARTNIWVIFIVANFVNVGMWFERFVIIVTSLHRDFLPSSWGQFVPTWTDLGLLIGSFGLFFTLFLLFLRFLPVIAMSEVRWTLPQSHYGHSKHHGNHAPAHAAHPAEIVDSPAAQGEPVFAVMAEFEDVDSVMDAAKKVRDAGYSRWDVHSPFAIHGIDKAMGVRPTLLPWITLCCGLTGLSLGLFGVWYANATTFSTIFGLQLPATFQGYQFLISGKPIFSLPANIPILFELTILFSAFSTVFGMLMLNRLPMYYNPVFKSERFRRVTADRFMVVIKANDPRYDSVATPRFLQGLGAQYIEVVRD